MFGSTVLEVAVGMTFCYATVALIVSTLQEALASATRLRARTLLAGVKTMLRDPRFDALARAVYEHALVNPHDGASIRPSYIEPSSFAIALVDAIASAPGDFEQLGRDIEAVPDPRLRALLQSLYARAGGDLARFQGALAGWFDTAMDRVSGSYKRRSQLASLLLSLLVAVLFNIDSIHLFRSLWQHPAVAAQLVAAPSSIDQRTIDALFSLPIGWTRFPPVFNQEFAMQVAGWMLTASSALFGAPFWFDLLQRTMQLRGTGSKPDDKTQLKVAASAPATAPAVDVHR